MEAQTLGALRSTHNSLIRTKRIRYTCLQESAGRLQTGEPGNTMRVDSQSTLSSYTKSPLVYSKIPKGFMRIYFHSLAILHAASGALSKEFT